MVAVDDRQGAHTPADPRISGACLRRVRAATVDVEERGDHLEVVLDAVVDFTDEPPLPFECGGRLTLGFLSTVYRPAERVTQLLDLLARADLARKLQLIFAWAIGNDRPLQPSQRSDEEPADQRPGYYRGGDPHQ